MFKFFLSLSKVSFLLIVTFFSACSQITSKEKGTPVSVEKEVVNEQEVNKSIEDEKKYQPSNMTAEMMYKVLLAEMLVKRQQSSAAFNILYPLAVETRDAKLAERVFNLSMQTLDEQAISASTNLWLDISPKESLPWMSAYLLELRAGNVEGAYIKWQKYIALSTTSLDRKLVETSLRVSTSVSKRYGLAFLKKIEMAYPDNLAAIFAVGSAAESYLEYTLAITKLKKSIDLYASMGESHSEYMLGIKKENYYLLANSYFNLGRYKEGIAKIEPQVVKEPSDWRLQDALARLEVRAGYLLKAKVRYQAIVDGEASFSKSRLSLALLQLDNQELGEAIDNLQILKRDRRYFPVAIYYLGVSEQRRKNNEKAVLYFSQVNLKSNYYLDAQLNLLEINFQSKGLAKTIQRLKQLTPRTIKDKLKIYRAAAFFYQRSQKNHQAIAEYQLALEVSPKNIDILLLQAYILYDVKKFGQYERNLLAILEVDPSHVDALNALGYYYVEHVIKLEQAAILLETANRLNPNSFYIIDSLGWLAYQKEEYHKSERLLEKAFGLEKDVEVFLHLIKVKVKLNKKDEAIELGKKYQGYFKSNKSLNRLLKKLEN